MVLIKLISINAFLSFPRISKIDHQFKILRKKTFDTTVLTISLEKVIDPMKFVCVFNYVLNIFKRVLCNFFGQNVI